MPFINKGRRSVQRASYPCFRTGLILAGGIIWGFTPHSSYGLTLYQGRDPGLLQSRPNSDAAAALFNTDAGQLGGINLIDFEDQVLGTIPPTGLQLPGVLLTAFDNEINNNFSSNSTNTPSRNIPWHVASQNQNASQHTSLFSGFNTTPRGEQFLGTAADITIILTFATPIQAFGAYLTGLGTGSGEVLLELSDGRSWNLSRQIGSSSGGASFFGFVDPVANITSVRFTPLRLTGNSDQYGIDDLRFVNTTEAIPTPSLLPGLAAFFWQILRKRKR